MISALFVEKNGCYFGIEGIDPWDITRDARTYDLYNVVIAHPPCERWGNFSTGSPTGDRKITGDDGGCFESALASLRRCGGVLEHPANSKAWQAFGLVRPNMTGWKWVDANEWVCRVEQGHYGHVARKATWLIYVGEDAPFELVWGNAPQRLPQKRLLERGYKSASRCGMVAYQSQKQRQRTPHQFRDLLIALAERAGGTR